jgi:excisionase family DNA binding protein
MYQAPINGAQLSASMSLIAAKLRYSRRESADLLGISVRQLDYHVSNGNLKVTRDGSRVLIHYTELVRFAKRDHTGTAREQ